MNLCFQNRYRIKVDVSWIFDKFLVVCILQNNVLGASKQLKEEIMKSYHDVLKFVLKGFKTSNPESCQSNNECTNNGTTTRQQILLVFSILTARMTPEDLSLVITPKIVEVVQENIGTTKEFCLQFLKSLTVQVV